MGLAYGVCEDSEQFEKIISEYVPSAAFAEQFKARIEAFRNEGYALSQYPLVEIELNCRRVIEKVAFG